jgi:hypothetical protein
MTASGRIGIVDLVEVCTREQARCTSLFEHLGAWVATTDDPALQRLFAVGAHRHAWHAELWRERTPVIPVTAIAADVAAISEAGDDTDRWAAYATALGVMISELDALRHHVDTDLDPSTARVIDLVVADARALATDVTGTPPG